MNILWAELVGEDEAGGGPPDEGVGAFGSSRTPTAAQAVLV